MPFPKNFVWGAATSSYQIEGAALEDGRGECIWHRFTHTPGKIKDATNGDIACDHYHRYADDVALMKQLGLQAYRFSVSWPRVLPTGVGPQNPLGLDFYDRLVDELLAAGITPYVTLYHWDLPQALQDRGGWANPDSTAWFTDYAVLMAQRLGDRVQHWITHNEPWVVSLLANWLGIHAPGLTDANTAYKVAHHVLISHGQAVQAMRPHLPGAEIGITLNMETALPATNSEADHQATHRFDGFFNRWFADPVQKGHYPADMVAILEPHLEGIDLSAISQAAAPTDFLGINYYSSKLVTDGEDNPLVHVAFVPNPRASRTGMDWEVWPDGLAQLLVRLQQDYQPAKIYVTENGSAYPDSEPSNGVVEDPDRTAYLNGHLQAVETAIAEGAKVAGYFAWSLMDNFEWAEGYTQRFGIIHVDYATQTRTFKRSALTYQQMIAANT